MKAIKQANFQNSYLVGEELKQNERRDVATPSSPPWTATQSWASLPVATLVLCPDTPTTATLPFSRCAWDSVQRCRDSSGILPLPLATIQSSSDAQQGLHLRLSLSSFLITCLTFLPALFLFFNLPCFFWLWSLGSAGPRPLQACLPWNPSSSEHCVPGIHSSVPITCPPFVIFMPLSTVNLFTLSMVPPLGWKLYWHFHNCITST